uniref:Poly(RC)-binding protein 2/3/4 n=2 Tax=Tetraselmis sp. GSL018 TaxID=582737 RepID=A0A061RNM9_9CHLO|mmetsp:Transcript_16335/g.38789  ORF Transcript_16335/g.38789 Transcript_16335/m.38789 type:complete len:395 (-) Transcript_16335:299-1483(-)|eukprot:CAMPEP_0177579220 /NCGR_PEP_ID=MMETSP0419_2-20121207/828_1 /TAXON_ID=582737 /ORGANISM="Tetraselmis sp., Strain GSL018" /LENGTH=394 /DNA_ID=CAMNT_0019067841 /DNA_START=164 /DNA_END=1348 /DNA_ORIENTATION=-
MATDPVVAPPVDTTAPVEPAVGEKRPLDDGNGQVGVVAAADGAVPVETEAPFKRQQVAPGRAAAAGGSREVVYRLLAPSKHAGYIIGKGGSLIKQIREETGARLKVVEGLLGCEERPVVISSKCGTNYDECNAKIAFFVMFQKLIEAEQHQPTVEAGQEPPLRLLVAQTQAGSLIGKSGVFIKHIRESTGANVRVLTPEELPLCALANDRVVQINGRKEVIESALKIITQKLYENPPREAPGGPPPSVWTALGRYPPTDTTGMMGLPSGSGLGFGAPPMQMSHYGMASGSMGGYQQPPMGGPTTKKTLMVPNNQVGYIIGSGGNNIAQIREKSGAQVKVHQQQGPPDPNAVRMIEITGQQHQVTMAETMIRAAGQKVQGHSVPQVPEPQLWGFA